MKTVLVALNAQYIHTNLAVRYMQELARKDVRTVEIAEYTINYRIPQLLAEIYRQKADSLVFSCYIWNIDIILELCHELKKVSPQTKIILAGPEVSFDSAALLAKHACVDAILCGEGESSFLPLLDWLKGTLPATRVPGLTHRSGTEILQTPSPAPIDLAVLPFPYADLSVLQGRILYFEATRGCPFRCSYCLSSVDKGVRFMPLPQVFAALNRFLVQKVPQVKFVDRTFNCNKAYALAIWKYLQQKDNGITNFHFEIAGELLDDETLLFLQTVRKGLFQFEIGVQSTNSDTLYAITRQTHIPTLLDICRRMDGFGNIHLHLDLIAGLPNEDKISFANSFNEVFAIRPQQLQLGFLKVLKGSVMHENAANYGIAYATHAPYEVLKTNWLCYEDMLALKEAEEMVEVYYNSGRFRHILEQMFVLFDSPFCFFAALGHYYTTQGYHLTPHSKEHRYEILAEFCIAVGLAFTPYMQQLCLLDICLHEKPKRLPTFLGENLNYQYKQWISNFFANVQGKMQYLPQYQDASAKEVAKQMHLQLFPCNPLTAQKVPTALLFDYGNRSLTGQAAFCCVPVTTE